MTIHQLSGRSGAALLRPDEHEYAFDHDPAHILAAIAERKFTVGVGGLGYVGLPLARGFSRAGFGVSGFDIDQDKVDALNAGRFYIRHFANDDVKALV